MASKKVSKTSVNYGTALGRKRCGNCSMFTPGRQMLDRLLGTGTCSLVRGIISDKAVCDRWEAK